MDDGRLDLTPLKPDPERVDRAADAVLARARGMLAGRQRMQASVWHEIPGWGRPLLATAALAALLSIVALIRVHPAAHGELVATLSEDAGVPAPVAAWVDSDQPPDPATLINW
jgi:hypothetical protein